MGREQPDIVVLDEDCIGGDACALVEALRATHGDDVEVLVLVRDLTAPDGRLMRLGARQLAKPIHAQILGAAVARMGTHVAERRRPTGET